MSKVKVGVVGLGNQGLLHVEALKQLPDAELVAVADSDFSRARRVAEEYRVRRYYGSARELAEDPDIDAVIVATPDYLHYEPVMAVLQAGKHVMVEKPMATRLDEAKAMAEEARRRGLLLTVNFENRFNPPFAHVKELLERGVLGAPIHAYIKLSDTIFVPRRMLSWASRTSVVFFLMSHTADLARWYFNEPVREVYATSVSRLLKDLGIPDACVAVLKFEGGFALLESSWVLPESAPSIFDFKLEIVCTQGVARVNTEKESMEVIGASGVSYPHLAKLAKVHGFATGFLLEADRHFLACVQGRAEPVANAEDGVENVRVLEAIVRSSLEGRPLTL